MSEQLNIKIGSINKYEANYHKLEEAIKSAETELTYVDKELSLIEESFDNADMTDHRQYKMFSVQYNRWRWLLNRQIYLKDYIERSNNILKIKKLDKGE